MKQQSQCKVKRWLARLGYCLIVSCIAAGGFWYWINIPPQIDIPNPVMPNPNGYDYFLRAGAAFVKDDIGVDETTDINLTPDKPKKYPIAAKEAWLQRNAKAFRLLREGLKYPSEHPRNTPSSRYSQFRGLARALVVESHARAERGDWNGAADSALDGLEFGYDIARGGPLTAGLVSNAVQAISLREMYQISSHLNAREAKLAAQRMEHLYAKRFPYFKTMQEEKWGYQAKMLELMKNKSWRLKTVLELSYPARTIALIQSLDSSYSPPSRLDTTKEFLKYSKIFFISNKTLIKNRNRMMDAYIVDGQMPYTKMRLVQPNSSDPFTQIFESTFNDTRWNWARMNTYTVLDMTMLALRAYRLEKGHYPANLKELAPEYLKTVPIDPFDGTQPLRYNLQGKKYLLWSIGSDGVDNQGTPVINQNKPETARYRLLDPDSKGDVVAGINMP